MNTAGAEPWIIWCKCLACSRQCGFPPIQLRFVRQGQLDELTCYHCGAKLPVPDPIVTHPTKEAKP